MSGIKSNRIPDRRKRLDTSSKTKARELDLAIVQLAAKLVSAVTGIRMAHMTLLLD